MPGPQKICKNYARARAEENLSYSLMGKIFKMILETSLRSHFKDINMWNEKLEIYVPLKIISTNLYPLNPLI